MTVDTEDILASRLNFDVEAFRGHSRHELILIGILSLLITLLVLSTLTRWLLGLWMVGVGFSFPTSIGVGWLIISVLQKFKAGKPRGYLKQLIRCQLEDHWGIRSPYVRYSGPWSIRRVR